MIKTLVLLGATGDLAGRFLLPALAALRAADRLPDDFQVVAAAREDLDDQAFQRTAAERLERHAPEVPATARADLIRSVRYRRTELTDPASVGSLLSGVRQPVAVYLALPPGLYTTVVTALGGTGLPAGSRIALEKPFGEDLDSAMALNRLLGRVTHSAGEQAVFRVDHVLGLPTVQNLLALRLANRVLEPVWNSRHIEQIDILWEEDLGLEGRAGYFDRSGTLRDVMQNHMLQVLSLIAMELPTRLDEQALRDRKLDALRSVRPLRLDEAASRTRRARYTAGRLSDPAGGTGRAVPAYRDEDGVDAARGTETFAEIVLDLDSERWSGTRFLLRAGKALHRRRKQVTVHFRRAEHPSAHSAPANELRIGLDGPEDLALHLTGGVSLNPPSWAPVTLTAAPPAADLPAYGRVLLDVLSGGSTLSVRGDEAEAAWRVMTPVLTAWNAGLVPLEEYAAGSAGPP
ncbi:glucose-6-phosphate dehydrogenase [Streptomyces europaeiscabiei]|uniref:glucose-6-phosphate dehydrogenase n=1 Tax=Streptomyces europaeiscabiei TaxID=146819 RepID=UPI0029BEE0E3|nr:glucose-6-phosphate dehydrogenase [Streptomyces europaeiscabiei]MDX3611255.1 glucose-6-phosphate dehydrogenase [Streptomyces europaeiscabiei]